MTVYVDVLIVLNIFVNYFLLSGAALILRQRPKRGRIVLGAFAGGLYSLVIFLPEISAFLSLLLNLAACCVFVLLSFAPKSFRLFLKEFAAFFAVSFVFAGLMLALWFFFRPRGMVWSNAVVYFDIDFKTLVLSTIACYLVLTLLSRLVKHRAPSKALYEVRLMHRGRAVATKALLDTGNALSDGFSDTPVLVGGRRVLQKLFSPALWAFFDGEAAVPDAAGGERIRLIPVGTVGGEGALRAVVIDEVFLPGPNVRRKNVLLAQSRADFGEGEYEVLLSPQLFDEREAEYRHEKARKFASKN